MMNLEHTYAEAVRARSRLAGPLTVADLYDHARAQGVDVASFFPLLSEVSRFACEAS